MDNIKAFKEVSWSKLWAIITMVDKSAKLRIQLDPINNNTPRVQM